MLTRDQAVQRVKDILAGHGDRFYLDREPQDPFEIFWCDQGAIGELISIFEIKREELK